MVYRIATIITVIGALNWGLVGAASILFGRSFDLVDWFWVGLLKTPLLFADLTYLLVGISAIVFISITLRGRGQ